MQIKNIILYNHKGDRRIVPFKLGKLNIITGKSRTGKSAVISIIDYCMGRSTFNVFDGVNRDVVSWYGVTYQLSGKQMFVAKKPPKNNGYSNSEAFLLIGDNIAPPNYEDLKNNTNDDAVRFELEKSLGFDENLNLRTEGREDSYQANLKHSKSFLFQEQGEIADKKNLFHRQDEPFMDQAIKDTFPYFLGAMKSDRLSKLKSLRSKQKELRKSEAEFRQSQDITSNSNTKAYQLICEAQNLGLLHAEEVSKDFSLSKLLNLLKKCLNWTPEEVNLQTNDELHKLQLELSEYEQEQTEYKEKLNQTRLFQKHYSAHSNNLLEHKNRLSPIGLFNPGSEFSCPICGSSKESDEATFENLTIALSEVNQQLDNISASTPKLKNYINELSSEENHIADLIEETKSKIQSLVRQRKESKLASDRNTYIARVIGRISLFLESVEQIDDKSELALQIDELKHEINILSQELDSESVKDKVTSALNIVSRYMGGFAEKLNLEYSNYPYRLDLSKLTVVADRPHGPIPMHRQGSGENWLGCHVSALLGLHQYFSEIDAPVPSLLVIDQPSQVYFPDLAIYKKLEGEIGEYQDIDLRVVSNLFRIFADFCKDPKHNFQIIVTEHANLDEPWFQDSLVEDPWRGELALIPYHWLNNSSQREE